jgi:hypothetical protein
MEAKKQNKCLQHITGTHVWTLQLSLAGIHAPIVPAVAVEPRLVPRKMEVVVNEERKIICLSV